MTDMNFWRITLDTNPDFCNLKCIMCEDHSPYSESKQERKANGRLRPIMPKAMLEKTIREAAALGIREVIPSTMGEPLLYPHFEVFLDLCKELNLSLNLTTNGTFPAPEKHQNVEYWAERIVPIGSDVKISWNGATQETHSEIMIGADLDKHIKNAKRFIGVRDQHAEKNYCSVTMQLTFLRSNLEEIPTLVDMAIEMGFDRVKGHHLWDHFAETEALSLRKDIRFAERWNQIVEVCQAKVQSHNLSSLRKFKLENFFPLSLDDLSDIAPGGECPFLGRELWVDPKGALNVCCAPDQQRKSLGDFGNVNDASLESLINRPQYRSLMSTYQNHPLCQSCNMRKPNASSI